MAYRDHRDLIVWKDSMELAKFTYAQTAMFPPSEKYGLVSQMQRCAVSIPSLIAEGNGRGGNKELDHYLRMANGSACELQTQAELSFAFGYITREILDSFNNQIESIMRRMFALRKNIQ